MNSQIPSRIVDISAPGVKFIASNNVTFVLQWGTGHFGSGYGPSGVITLPQSFNSGAYYIGMIPVSSSHCACLYVKLRKNTNFTWYKDANDKQSAEGNFLWFCLGYY